MAFRVMRPARLAARLRPAAYRPAPAAAPARLFASGFGSQPSPPRLPAEEQAEFERLQRTANTQEGFNPSTMPPEATPEPAATKTTTTATATLEDELAQRAVPLRKGAPPEFEGDVNPKTGEVGGPKNEPLRWGAGGDYSYNGRVTDF